MTRYSRQTLQTALENQLKRLKKKIELAERWSNRVSGLRLATFLVGTGLLFFFIYTERQYPALVIFALFTAVFILMVIWHRRLDHNLGKLRIWKNARTNHLARITLDWSKLPYNSRKIESTIDDHAYAKDLNIVGQHSLIHLIDTSIYKGGTKKLAAWLLDNDPDPEKIAKRQNLVEELKPMARFRDRLHLNAELAKSQETVEDWDMSTLIKWLKSDRDKTFRLSLTVLFFLSFLNILLLILYFAGVLAPWVIVTFLLYLLVYNFNSSKFSGLFDESYQIEKLLSRFSSILLFLEKYPYKKKSGLKQFCNLYHDTEHRPSLFLKKIVRISMAASSQKSELIWLLLNAIIPWDLYFAYKLHTYKEELEEHLTQWLDRFYELEALNSLANFAWLNPDYTFQSISPVDSRIAFKAEALGHPLIPHNRKVTNSVTIQDTGTLLLITGSNMAGKSTFLRTMGINLCLCFAGAPVNASELHTVPMRIFSSINVTDSLDEGLSHFYAEVKKLRQLLDQLKKEHPYPLFFLVDEIFRGTNNRERLTGSKAFLKDVAGKNGIGLISTHDLELAGLENEIPQLFNYHFEETIEDGKMRFEYKLKPGPCPTTNALKIMEMEGLPT